MNKYRAQKVKDDGYTFDSKAEHRRYRDLLLLERAGEIASLAVHPKFDVEVNGVRVCTAIMDFEYVKDGEFVVEDVKGRDTPVSRLKRKLVEALHGIKVQVVTGGGAPK